MSYEKSAHLFDLFAQKENISFFVTCAAGAESVLDIGAGTGRIAIQLAEQGVKVCCVEPSPAMRKVFANKLTGRHELVEHIKLIDGDARTFAVDHLFPVAFLSGCFDHFLSEKERIASLENIGRHLVVGGVLVFDVFIGMMDNSSLSPAGCVTDGTMEIRRFVGRRLLPNKKKMEINLIYEIFEAGKKVKCIEERGLVGIVDRQDVHSVLEKAGYGVRHEWGGYDFLPYREGEDILITQAVKVKQ